MEYSLEKELKKFNWGAAYLGLIWAIVNGCFKKWFIGTLLCSLIATVIAVILIAIVLGLTFFAPTFINPFVSAFLMIGICILASLAIFIYIGKKGNIWAWENFDSKDIDKFIKIQKKWGTVAIVLLSISLAGLIVQIITFSALSSLPTSENKPVAISKENCQAVYNILPKTLSSIKNDEQWVDNLEKALEADDTISTVLNLSDTLNIYFAFNDKPNGAEGRAEFKIVKEPSCSISEANCYMTAITNIPETACRFYFDDNGNVAISKLTRNFLNE